MPKVEFKSNAKASMFAYPPPLEEKKEKESEKVETAVLSITVKAKRKEKQKGKTEAVSEKKTRRIRFAHLDVHINNEPVGPLRTLVFGIIYGIKLCN